AENETAAAAPQPPSAEVVVKQRAASAGQRFPVKRGSVVIGAVILGLGLLVALWLWRSQKKTEAVPRLRRFRSKQRRPRRAQPFFPSSLRRRQLFLRRLHRARPKSRRLRKPNLRRARPSQTRK